MDPTTSIPQLHDPLPDVPQGTFSASAASRDDVTVDFTTPMPTGG
ncbi:hypothetical protein ACJU26_03530 [Acidithiobacillus sp. M4-SHS-6]